ncbi:hypothetical protein EX30DRAFT_339915 [Ascodesmis nigricans]|uniref:Tctex-1 n=1 Tax=Ascodesmis nigricans TaxID=341454 RepID=A0A4S2N0S7_9PEZI|nr:hypothetical protein EX30DRAFT_339915 [Ascodesmis nigricans]
MSTPDNSKPLPEKRLEQIANDACTNTLSSITAYDHTLTSTWNTAIINHILRSLISETTPAGDSAGSGGSASSPPWKFAVQATIIQHLGEKGGRRGMHSAIGAYWNNERDGMWSWKFEHQVVDVVVSVVWVHV